MYDLIIIGSGPAGLSAAVYATGNGGGCCARRRRIKLRGEENHV